MRISVQSALLVACVLYFINLSEVSGIIRKQNVPAIRRKHYSWRSHQSWNKWIVISLGAHTTYQMRHLHPVPGWKTVVIGDDKAPKKFDCRNCTYLNVYEQDKLGFQTTTHLGKHGVTRKNVGFLYAIAQGAEIIYESNGQVTPQDALWGFNLKNATSGLLFTGASLFNPYKHFGQDTLWPRGYPLASVSDSYVPRYVLDEWKTPVIQQQLVDGHPDVDAIVELTRMGRLNVSLDIRAPFAIVPNGVLSPLNAHNTLFTYKALWALMLPVTTGEGVSDIWRGYWAQRLLWEIGENVGYFPPNTETGRNAEFIDAEKENDLFFKTDHLLAFLRLWTCPSEKKFFFCVRLLSKQMVQMKFWGDEDEAMTNSWIEDLQSVGYKQPERVVFHRQKKEINLSRNRFVKSHHGKYSAHIQFVPEDQGSPGDDLTPRHRPVYRQMDKISKVCPNLDMGSSLRQNRHIKRHGNILLVVVLDEHKNYDAIKDLDAMYSLKFPHIVYCATTMAGMTRMADHLAYKITFVAEDTRRGRFSQKCLIAAMRMNYRVDGYLFLKQNTLLNVWMLDHMPTDKIWMLNPMPSQDRRNEDLAFRKQLSKAYKKGKDELLQIDKFLHMEFKMRMWENTQAGDEDYVRRASHMIYLPLRYKEHFIFYAEIFTKAGLYYDVTIPTVISGMEDLKSVIRFEGVDSSTDMHKNIENNYNKTITYFNPVDIKELMSRPEGQDFICLTYIPTTFSK